jgi:leucyl aminopeptidase (aminopeptidase T)
LEEAARLAAEEKKKEMERKKKLEEEAKRAEEEQKEVLAHKLKEEKEALLEKKYTQPEQPHTQSTISSNRAVNTNHLGNSKAHIKVLIQKWMSHITTQGVATSGAALIFIFALFAILRGQRGRLTVALQGLLSKLWQTIKMGTKVTYM